MKKLIFILMVGSLFVGCASVDRSMLTPEVNSISNKIKPLTVGLGNEVTSESENTLTTQTYFTTILTRTLEQNIYQGGRDIWGYIEAKQIFAKSKPTALGYIINASHLYLLTYFGAPFQFNHQLEYEFTIYDSNKNKIKTYTMSKEKTHWQNIYQGLPQREAFAIEQIKLFHSIMRDLETNLNADADYINAELEKTGTIK